MFKSVIDTFTIEIMQLFIKNSLYLFFIRCNSTTKKRNRKYLSLFLKKKLIVENKNYQLKIKPFVDLAGINVP